MSLKIKIDTSFIAKELKDFSGKIKADLDKGVKRLAAAAHDHILQNAAATLSSSTMKKFKESVGFENPSEGIWVVSIDEKGLWVEEGIEPNTDMKPGLLKNAETSKNGFKTAVIPFDKTKTQASGTAYEFELRQRVQSLLKKEGVGFKKLDKDANGKPIHGDVNQPKLIGKYNFGGEIPGKGNTPVLKGVSIYQTLTKTGNIRRDILTFRTVSSGPASAGKWFHPGLDAKKYMEKAQAWAEKEWETTILPGIVDKYK